MHDHTLDLFTTPAVGPFQLLHTLELFDDMTIEASAEIEYIDAVLRRMLLEDHTNPDNLKVVREQHARRAQLARDLRRYEQFRARVPFRNPVVAIAQGGAA